MLSCCSHISIFFFAILYISRNCIVLLGKNDCLRWYIYHLVYFRLYHLVYISFRLYIYICIYISIYEEIYYRNWLMYLQRPGSPQSAISKLKNHDSKWYNSVWVPKPENHSAAGISLGVWRPKNQELWSWTTKEGCLSQVKKREIIPPSPGFLFYSSP